MSGKLNEWRERWNDGDVKFVPELLDMVEKYELTETVHVFIRIDDNCRIDTYILTESDKHWEKMWEELISNGYRFSNTRKIELKEMKK